MILPQLIRPHRRGSKSPLSEVAACDSIGSYDSSFRTGRRARQRAASGSRRLAHLGARRVGVGCRARSSSPRSRSRRGSGGWTSARRCGRTSSVSPLSATRSRRGGARGLPARDGRQQPLRRSAAVGLRRRVRLAGAGRARHDRRAHHHPGRRADGPGTDLGDRRQQERRHGRSRVHGALLLAAAGRGPRQQGRAPVHRRHRSRHRARAAAQPRAGIATPSSTPPTSAVDFRRCRCSDSCRRR